MILVGSGALLTRAVGYARRASLSVDVICCSPGEPGIQSLRQSGATVVETDDPSTDLPPFFSRCTDGIGFSINNKHILTDTFLAEGVAFFNIHNGLVQRYRGVAEICVFAGLCKRELQYGVTLHSILPRQKVDAGPVIDQLMFPIGEQDVFSDVMRKSLDACQRIFELNAERVISKEYAIKAVESAPGAYSYRDVSALCSLADAAALGKARNLGIYASFFPRLKAMLESAY